MWPHVSSTPVVKGKAVKKAALAHRRCKDLFLICSLSIQRSSAQGRTSPLKIRCPGHCGIPPTSVHSWCSTVSLLALTEQGCILAKVLWHLHLLCLAVHRNCSSETPQPPILTQSFLALSIEEVQAKAGTHSTESHQSFIASARRAW